MGAAAMAACTSVRSGLDPFMDSKYDFLAGEASARMTKSQRESVQNVNVFAYNLAGDILSDAKESSVICPVTLGYALGMAANGADGQTREEICGALGWDASDIKTMNEFFRDALVLSSRQDPEGGCVVETTNLMLHSDKREFFEDYRKTLKNYYNAPSAAVNMFDTKGVVERVNAWAEANTHGLIKNLLNNGDITSDTIAILLSSLYLKVTWQNKFNKTVTKDGVFHGENGNRTVPMMHKVSEIWYGENDFMQSVYLPMEGSVNMSVMLPKDGHDVSELFIARNRECEAETAQVTLSLPKFKAEFKGSLMESLQRMGIDSMFDSVNADFGNMTQSNPGGNGNPFVSDVIQANSLSVDEDGCEGASVTAMIMDGASSPGPHEIKKVEFRADRPFLFQITEANTGAILFLGCCK